MTAYEPLVTRTSSLTGHPFGVQSVALRHAVRRDLTRLARVLGEPVTAVRRAALIDHVGYLMDQLHDYHRLLDRVVSPVLIRRQPHIADHCEALERAHAELAEVAATVRERARRWQRTGAAADRAGLRAVMDDFAAELEPTLELDIEWLNQVGEELEAGDWGRPDRKGARRGRPTTLARRMFWLLDELDQRQRDALLDRTPRAVMWVLRNGFSGAYNRSSYLMWAGGGTGPAV